MHDIKNMQNYYILLYGTQNQCFPLVNPLLWALVCKNTELVTLWATHSAFLYTHAPHHGSTSGKIDIIASENGCILLPIVAYRKRDVHIFRASLVVTADA